MMSSTTVQTLGRFGVEISGLDLNTALRDDGSMDHDTMHFLCQALYANQVIVIRDQSFVERNYLNFGRQWGEPIPHVLDHMRMAGFPEMMTVGNTEQRDRDSKIRNGAALWHTDQSYEAIPASTTMLYSIKAPDLGGETQFCNMRLAYESLCDSDKSTLARLQVAHKYGYGRRAADEPPVNPLINDKQDQRVPPVYHPLVMRHPIADTPALYALGHGAHGIKDGTRNYTDEDTNALLDRLRDHALQEDFIYRHKYRRGDVVIWDTLQTMHRATVIDVPASKSEERLLWRISVRDKPGVFCN